MLMLNDRNCGFTGTQKGLAERQRQELWRVLRKLRDEGFDVMHNGDCIGADAEAGLVWRNLLGGKLHLHPPRDPSKRAWLEADWTDPVYDYLTRDLHIAERSRTLVACPKENTEVIRSGTWTTVRYARNLGQRKIIIIRPDGSVT